VSEEGGVSEEGRARLQGALKEAGRDWRDHLRLAARTPEGLAHYGLLTSQEASALKAVSDRYETLVTPYYLSLIDPLNPACPIRLQALPHPSELEHLEGEERDPIGDDPHKVTPILVHRYQDRALLFPTYRCPMFCRYCFRKDALNSDAVRLHEALPKSLEYLRAHPELKEVILSGGDPLMLPDTRLAQLLSALKDAGVKRLRLHTRFPVTLPHRVTQPLATLLGEHSAVLVTHFNHPRELTIEAREALERLRLAGVRTLNQAVLLRGVNDQEDTLRDLMSELLEVGALPYYLHHPDLTAGTQHFRVSLRRGLELTRALRGSLTGLAQPRYVIDVPRGGGKVPVDSAWVQPTAHPRHWLLTSPITGETQPYTDLAEPKEPV
jgi:lysine 2,3-aminomutase